MNQYQPHHQLDTVEAKLSLPRRDVPDGPIVATVVGRAQTKRGHLWVESNVWTPDEAPAGLAPSDWVHHILLCSIQDRPNTSERLLFSLTGGLGIQDELPY